MLFNSLSFAVFFPLVVVFYFSLAHKHRWKLLLAASYYFYMCWRVEYIFLIIASTLVDYFAALKMGEQKTKAKRRTYLFMSLAVNLGMLFAFKYFNFATTSLQTLFNTFNIFIDVPTFNVLLPVGISFYTFQTLSYSIEVYWGKIKPEKHLGIFALYVVFFPQLVAGPIERPGTLLPQFRLKREYSHERFREGIIRMLMGFFKKLVIAEHLAVSVNNVFADPKMYSAESVLFGVYFFAFQIYCDFSGYSDIAIGGAKILGYDLMENFRQPYHSKSISEFWRRWHISLSTWFRDYVYIPMGGSRVNRSRLLLNLWVVFTVSGLWHGANWTFVVWGAYHGLLLMLGTVLSFESMGDSRFSRAVKTIVTFNLVCLGWIFFRAENMTQAFYIMAKIGTIPLRYIDGLFHVGVYTTVTKVVKFWLTAPFGNEVMRYSCLWIFVLECLHWVERRGEGLGVSIAGQSRVVRWSFYTGMLWLIVIFGYFDGEEFLYFQF